MCACRAHIVARPAHISALGYAPFPHIPKWLKRQPWPLEKRRPRRSVLESAVNALPDLTPEARVTVFEKARVAADILTTGTNEACARFAKSKRRDNATLGAALESFRRAEEDAKIAAQRHLFDAVAREYQLIDKDGGEYSERLRTVVLHLCDVSYLMTSICPGQNC